MDSQRQLYILVLLSLVVQYKKHIHLLGVDNYKYKFLGGFELYKMLLEHMDYLHIEAGILFLSLKTLDNHIFHQMNILNQKNTQLLYMKPMDFLEYQEGSSRWHDELLLYILLEIHK